MNFSTELRADILRKKKRRPGLAPFPNVMIYNLPAIPTAPATASLATPTTTATAATKATAGASFLGTRFIDR
jgi:hypothetical protein